ncbi:hypothetical protein [Stenotrophomonas nitritireducens]|uniref:hypothetical protein n=1 Tax=Stenotrophomonas nitritireducens TaxID=83617 RepID=UPI00128FB339|nr:hypothetical protein [Stenotrophomonas nitritireducens]
MHSAQEVQSFLREKGILIAGSAVRDSGGRNFYYVFVEVQKNARGHQEPTNAALDAAKVALEQEGALVEFILTDGATRDIEAGLRATLLHSFGRSLRNSFLSSSASEASVWVVPKHGLSDDERTQIEEKAKIFLKEVGLTLRHITATTEENLPAKTRILTVLRQVAPAAPAQLVQHLRDKGFVIPSDDWMTRQLDGLRKAGMVVRMKSGLYAVTAQGLKGLGTVKGRSSPDVSRLLALASNRG